MATALYNAENGTAGSNVTTSHWPAVSPAGAWTFQTAAARLGNLGYRLATAGTTTAYLLSNALVTSAASNAERFRLYIKCTARPTSGNAMIFQTQAPNGTNLVNVMMTPSGTLQVNDQSALKFTSTFVVPLNTWVRIELVVSGGGGTTTTGIIGFGARADNLALSTTNDATNAYYWTTTAACGGTAGWGNFAVGKNEATSSWTASVDFDDITGDNSSEAARTWTSAPSTWIGPGANPPVTFSVAWSAVSTAGMTVGGRVDLAPGEVLSAATSLLVLDGVRGQNSILPMVAGYDDFTIATAQTDRLGILPMTGSSTLSVAGGNQLQFVLALTAGSSATLGPVREQLYGVTLAAAGGSLTIGPLRSQFATVPMVGTAIFIPIPNPGQSGIWLATGQGSLTISGTDLLSFVLGVNAAAQLGVGGLKSLSSVLTVWGTPTLTVGGLKTLSAAWSAAASSALVVSGQKSLSSTLSMSALARLVIAARVFADIHPYDDVLAKVLDGSALAVPLANGARVLLMGDGLRKAVLLTQLANAKLLTGPALSKLLLATAGAVLLDPGTRNGKVLDRTAKTNLLSGDTRAAVLD